MYFLCLWEFCAGLCFVIHYFVLLWVCHFPIGILCQVWYLIVSIPDLCTLTYFVKVPLINYLLALFMSNKQSVPILCLTVSRMCFSWHKTKTAWIIWIRKDTFIPKTHLLLVKSYNKLKRALLDYFARFMRKILIQQSALYETMQIKWPLIRHHAYAWVTYKALACRLSFGWISFKLLKTQT